MATKLTTRKNAYNLVGNIIEDIQANNSSSYYFFYGNHDPDIESPPDVVDTISTTDIDVFSNMIGGKRIQNTDIVPVIRNVPYEANTKYAMYDDTLDLSEEDFYVITNEGSFYHVFKCLDNNMGGLSTTQPLFAHVSGANTAVYQTSDGYRWKYMYSVSDFDQLKFSTDDLFPVFANATVSNSAVDGAVDIIVIDGAGQRYDNYVTGTLATSNIRVGSNGQVYEIANTTASLSNGFYTGCIMYLTSGTGLGQYQTVISYFSNTTGKYVVLANSFPTSPTNGTEYEIYPEVKVRGTGQITVNCVARALVNALSANSLSRVEILNRGAGYDYVGNCYAIANSSVAVSIPAILRGINSPSGGHGFDAVAELLSNSAIISIELANSESNTLPTVNEFKQIGMIINPVFANVAIAYSNKTGTFLTGETIYKIDPLRLGTNATINTTSANLVANSADFATQLAANDYVYLVSGDGLSQQLGQVNSVTNSSQIVLKSNGTFASNGTTVYKTSLFNKATVTSSNSTHIIVTEVSTNTGRLTSNDLIIGANSGAKATVNSFLMNDVAKSFDTFLQLYKYQGVLNSGSFENNEYVIQSNTTLDQDASALLHSTVLNGSNITIYTTKQNENFLAGGANTLTGNTSGAVMRVANSYPGELHPGKGDVIFLENISPITRNANTTETFQLRISF